MATEELHIWKAKYKFYLDLPLHGGSVFLSPGGTAVLHSLQRLTVLIVLCNFTSLIKVYIIIVRNISQIQEAGSGTIQNNSLAAHRTSFPLCSNQSLGGPVLFLLPAMLPSAILSLSKLFALLGMLFQFLFIKLTWTILDVVPLVYLCLQRHIQ